MNTFPPEANAPAEQHAPAAEPSAPVSQPTIRRELTISIHPFVASYDDETVTHTTNGTISLSVEERGYEEQPDGRRKPVNIGCPRSIAWEQHETFADALASATAHAATWNSEEAAR